MKLSDKFTYLQQQQQQKDEKSNIEISLRLFQDIFFSSSSSTKNSDSEKTTREETPSLKIFAAGLPRTGTGSLAVALTKLGYKPCHGPCVMELESILAKHYAGQATNSDIIQNTLDEHGYDVLGLDQLGWKLYKEDVLSEDEEVKIILTEHPGGGIAWAESWSSFVPDHIYYFSHLPFSFIGSLQQVMKLQKEFLLYISSLASNESSGNSLSSNTSDDPRNPTFMFPATNLAMAYEKHNEAVKKKFGNNNNNRKNNDRLLVFNPTQGWDPLCNFLNVEKESCPSIEDEPFPRMTDRQMMMAEATEKSKIS